MLSLAESSDSRWLQTLNELNLKITVHMHLFVSEENTDFQKYEVCDFR